MSRRFASFFFDPAPLSVVYWFCRPALADSIIDTALGVRLSVGFRMAEYKRKALGAIADMDRVPLEMNRPSQVAGTAVSPIRRSSLAFFNALLPVCVATRHDLTCLH